MIVSAGVLGACTPGAVDGQAVYAARWIPVHVTASHGDAASMSTFGVPPRVTAQTADWGWATGATARPPERPSLAAATSLSALLPGAGQYYLGQQRAWVYLTLEAAGLYLWTDRRRAGSRARDDYRDFAWNEARVQVEPRREGDFDYYETMSAWDRSGAFDTDPSAPGIQPEMEPGTFNASIWSLAERLFLGAPGTPSQAAMDRAIAYYEERAYPTDQLWNWESSPGGRVRFGELIEESDARFRQATNVLGAVIANHVVSAIDAFVSARGMGERIDLRIAPAPSSTPHWQAVVRIGVR